MAKTWAELKAERDRRLGTKLEDTTGYRRAMVALATGEAIRAARLQAGLTQKTLAERMGTSQPQIARLEAGHTSAKVETLARVVEATGAPLLLSPAAEGEVAVALAEPEVSSTADARSSRAVAPPMPPPAIEGVWQPALDISQDDGSLVIDVDLPGLDAENIVLEIADGVLRIGGKTAAMRSHDATYLAERKSGAFERVVSLPPGADASKVEAHYGNGVLTVTVALPEPGPATARPIVNWGANSHDVFEKARSPQRLNTIAVTH